MAQLRAGLRIRKTIWGKGHVRLEGGRLIVIDTSGDECEVSEAWLAADFGSWKWEIDGPRKYVISGATRVDLAMLPPDITLGQLGLAIERCIASDNNFNALVISAWEAVGARAVGENLIRFAETQEGYVLLQSARHGHDREALPRALTILDAMRKAGGR